MGLLERSPRGLCQLASPADVLTAISFPCRGRHGGCEAGAELDGGVIVVPVLLENARWFWNYRAAEPTSRARSVALGSEANMALKVSEEIL